jgi:hypothetical protein
MSEPSGGIGNTVLKNNIWSSSIDGEGSSIPTTGNWNLGDSIRNTNPAAGDYVGWVCTTAGTLGTLSDITGSVSSGSLLLTVNSVTGLKLNELITIAGVSGTKYIRAISGLIITLSSASNATVVDAAIDFSPAVFKGFGAISA